MRPGKRRIGADAAGRIPRHGKRLRGTVTCRRPDLLPVFFDTDNNTAGSGTQIQYVHAGADPFQGLLLQKLTTREPDDSMIEVAIASVEAVFDWKAYLKENEKLP